MPKFSVRPKKVKFVKKSKNASPRKKNPKSKYAARVPKLTSLGG